MAASMVICRIFMLLSLTLGAWAGCLPNATKAIDRKDLKNLITGQSYAIGLWRNGDYPAARLIARVVQIVVQEIPNKRYIQ